MLIDATPTTFVSIYMCCGYTDLRKSIDGLTELLVNVYDINPYVENVLFLFCGRASYKVKGLVWEKNGFTLINKRLSEDRFHWDRNQENGLKGISYDQFIHLMNEGSAE
ncbi:MAG: IS66 family insertion sequence element accessory protein TnpB [Clostridia bacterium]|nr:IS66 family insertion sequence element accessory protein TnpB [Clostridia bacterium]